METRKSRARYTEEFKIEAVRQAAERGQPVAELADNPYDRAFERLRRAGKPSAEAALAIVEDYLDGKPRLSGKRKLTRAERDTAFWYSLVVAAISPEQWATETFVLALARYFEQERVANPALVQRIAETQPDSICRAVRYSGLVLRQSSPRRTELDQFANVSTELAELCRMLDVFDEAYRHRRAAVEMRKAMLADLSPVELLAYASLFAFEHLVPAELGLTETGRPAGLPGLIEAWRAINELLHWKIETCPESDLALSEQQVALVIRDHVSPFIFPSPDGASPRFDLRENFMQLLLDQVELDAFISRSADAFSYDEGVRFVRKDNVLELETVDPDSRSRWEGDGRKLEHLYWYWANRGIDQLIERGLADATIGRPENHEANQCAYILALGNQLRLSQVYGVDSAVTTDSGYRLELFTALLSVELMTVHFRRDFLHKYGSLLNEAGHWMAALSKLAFEGFVEGENRLPFTWSSRAAKLERIKAWTVSKDFPDGDSRAAAAILDLWTTDWKLARRARLAGNTAPQPDLFERPVLQNGSLLIQLPWVVGFQNNSTAAINNLRRLGARRSEVLAETRRIEESLGRFLVARGFAVVLNWHPSDEDRDNAGEVDLICHLDGILIVLEVKSTYVRMSQRDAWLHGTTTLRKAGK